MIKNWILGVLSMTLVLAACSTQTAPVRDGQTAYERKQYAVAAELLQKDYNKSKSRVEKGKLAYLIANSFDRLNKSEQSIKWYQIAYDNQYGLDALKAYAFALKKAERYEEAMQAFKDLGLEIGSPYEYRREISACQVAIGWKSNRQEYEIELLEFNSGSADYAPVIYKDNQLVFTSDRSASTGKDTYFWTGNAFSDLFVVDLGSNAIAGFDAMLNTANNEGTVCFNQAFTEVYFSRCFSNKKDEVSYCKIMHSEWTPSGWSEPQVLPFTEDKVNYVQPSLSPNGRLLYFSANHPDGWGGYDIYAVEKSTGGEWGQPALLSRSINTSGDEKFPFIDQDTLYFSSDNHTGMGGLDVFRSFKMRDGSWSPAHNLKTPINSGGDDFGYAIDYTQQPDGAILQKGYFTSTRESGVGNDDIYRFTKIVLPPEPEVIKPEPKPEDYKILLHCYVLEKIYEFPDNPNSKILGRKPLPGAGLSVQFERKKEKKTIDEAGFVVIELQENTDYQFLASNEGYLTNDATFTTIGIGKDPENPVQIFELEIVLEKIFVNQEIRLENIYYDFDRWEIRDDAKPTLDELVRNLKLNPAIQIQLSSHTDCRGSDRYNEDLSQRRAQSAVNYLIEKGIDPVRLSARGYGEGVPEASCLCARCSEEEHQQNRRTTFTILQ
ncbi:MAG TPA: OmpA family protein [Saprospiraceae bacterium]|nr:OmpA family protein [Saprospiraceae bacterium]HMQ83603.1 OmpA family protein [Saprospiraceae bacterium]